MTRTGNDFAHMRVDMQNVLRITCASCGEVADRRLASGARTCAQSFAEKMFRNKRWHVGTDRKHDKCPACVKADKLKVSTIAEHVIVANAAAEAVAAAEPVDFSMDDKGRIELLYAPTAPVAPAESDTEVLAKLIAEHTYSKASGLRVYKAGMTDARMAELTGMRVDIVRDARIRLFGKAKAGRKAVPKGLQPDRRIGALQDRLDKAEASQQALQGHLEALALRYDERIAQTEKLLQTLASAMKGANERLQELSDEFDLLSEPVSISPRSLLQLFNGQANLRAKSTQSTMHHKHRG